MTEQHAAFRKIAERLSMMAAPKDRAEPIKYDTELYYDLHLYGDDLFEFVRWVDGEFGVRADLDFSKYGPREFPFVSVLHALRSAIGLGEPQYQSLKVSDVITAIEAKRWPRRD